MKKTLIALGISLGLIMTGCQQEEVKIDKVAAVPLMANEELVIPDTDKVTMQEETVWVVDQYKQEWDYNISKEEKGLVLTNEQGVVHEITKDYLSWKVIEQDGKDSIYYVDSRGMIYSYDPQTEETIEIGGKESKINSADIQKDDITGNYYAILVEHIEGSYYYNRVSVLDLLSGEIVVSDLSALSGLELIYDGKLYYTKELYTPSYEEYGSVLDGMTVEAVDQINTYDLKTGEDTVFFNLESFYKKRNMLEQISQKLGKYSSCMSMYYEANHLLIGVYQVSEGGDWPQYEYDINLASGNIQPLGSEERYYPIVGGRADEVFIRDEKVYAIVSYNDGSKALNVFDLKVGKACLGEEDLQMQTPIGLDEEYIYMYDSKNDSYFMNDIMANLKENTDKLYKINIDTLQKEKATIDEIPTAKFERDDHYIYSAFNVKDGIFTQNISNETAGLFKKGVASPFFTSQLDIVSFEKATILSEQKLNLLSDTDAFTLALGETKAINYQVDQDDTKLYFTSTHPEVARVDQTGKVTAGGVGSTHITITAIKEGYKRDTKHIYVEVTGNGKVPLSLSTQILLLAQGERVEVNYESLDGADLNVISDKDLVALEGGEKGSIYVTGQTEGLDILRFKVSKEGYESQEIVVPIMVGMENASEAVTHLTQHWQDLRSGGVVTEQDREQVAKEADYLMAHLVHKTFKAENNTLHMSQSVLGELNTLNWNMAQQINKLMNQSKTIPNRSFGMASRINLSGLKDKASITLESKDLEAFGEDMSDVVVEMDGLGVSLKLPLSNWQALMGDHETIRFTIKKNDDNWEMTVMSEKEGDISTLDENVYLIFHDTAAADTSVTRITNQKEIPLAGNYDMSENGLLVGTNKAGIYRLQTKEVNYSDISKLDESLQEAIIALTQSGVITQDGETDKNNFRPDDEITRAEFASMMINAFYLYDEELVPSFTDITPSDWYYNYVGSSEAHEIVEGYPDGSFKPNDVITKEQMIAIAGRWLKVEKGYNAVQSIATYIGHLKDQEEISEWAREEVAFAIRENLVEVPRDNLLNPKQGMKRSEAVLLINDLLGRLY